MSLLTFQEDNPVTPSGVVADDLQTLLRSRLLRLAKAEDDRAADEAANVPYWAPLPASVTGHRAAAAVLRRAAEGFLP